MYLRPHRRRKNGKDHTYWSLVESVRTAKGPRNRIVAYLGEIEEAEREGWVNFTRSLDGRFLPTDTMPLFVDESDGDDRVPETVTVEVRGVTVDQTLDFGDVWLATLLWRTLELDRLLSVASPAGKETVPWSLAFAILTFARFCEPGSELHVSERWYPQTALPLLFGVPPDAIHPSRLYRALDRLLPHKDAIEQHLRRRLGTLFKTDYDILLYDITSTYFEGRAERNPQAQYGYSRDNRSDCKQVCIGLVVTREGLPLGYEVFDGNRSDATTVQEIVAKMESKYGQANRIWIMDRGMASDENLAFIRDRNGRYIVNASRTELKQYENELRSRDWTPVYEDLEVKLVEAPGGSEKYVLCRSAARAAKERAMHERFAKRIEADLTRLAGRLAQARKLPKRSQVERQVGRILERNAHSGRRYDVHVNDDPTRPGHLTVSWTINAQWDAWMELRDGAYLLRTNVGELDGPSLWKMYSQLTDVEDSFRTIKSDLSIRPVFHQLPDRVQGHILVAFLAYALWKTLDLWCAQHGLGHSARTLISQMRQLKCTRVLLPTNTGRTLALHCVTRPDPALQSLVDRLHLDLPTRLGPPRWRQTS